jgi:ATP/maltotriose-dependent transcriptional regulator MalT
LTVADPPTTDPEPVEPARAAARRLAWDEAYAAYVAADADATARLDADDLQLWATAAYLLGRVDAAVDVQARAFEAHRHARNERAAARCGFWIVFILMNRGDQAQASGWLARCQHMLDGLPPDAVEHGYLLLWQAFRLAAAERAYTDARHTAEQVVDVGRRSHDDDLVALGLTVGGRAAISDGQPDDGLVSLDEAMAAAVAGALSPPIAGTVYCSLVEACEQIGEVRRAREWTDALTRWCDRQRGMLTFTGQCLTHRATILRRHGEWQAAEQQALQACERFAGAADEAATGMALYELAEVHRVRGDLAAAEDAYRQAGAWGHDPQPGLALSRLAQGHAAVAAATMRRLLDERTEPIDRLKLLPAHVTVMLAVDDASAATAAAHELAAHAATYGTDALRAAADRARGAVLIATGDASAAAGALRRALNVWRSLGAPYDAARTRVLISQACDQLGDHDTAALELDAARRTFTELGAAADLAGLAVGAGPGAAKGLTPREHEVLRLVATGMTNQAIARELFVAVKTVDRHVGNILAKLGVASRTAATAFAYEHDLL